MNPIISNMSEDEGVLEFTLSGIHMSLANAIRRTVLSDIPTIVFRTSPYKENKATFHKNTTRLNNEILKQRLSCIPIHIQDLETPLQDLEVIVQKKNDTDSIQYVTTKDFKIKNIIADKFLEQNEVKKIFPADFISGTYIDFARLRPKISDEIKGEELSITAKMDIGTAAEDGTFNVVSACSYGNTPDEVMMDTEWKKALVKLAGESDMSKDEQDLAKQNWYLLDGKRFFKQNSFDFMVETIGVYENKRIIFKAITIIIERLLNINKMISDGEIIIEQSDSTLSNGYDIKLEGYDYTIGKILEYVMYQSFYMDEEILTYIAFKKIHPHDSYGLFRIAYENPTDNATVVGMIQKSIDKSVEIFQQIIESFNN